MPELTILLFVSYSHVSSVLQTTSDCIFVSSLYAQSDRKILEL